MAYQHNRCIAAYMAPAMAFYRYRHIERGTGMILKSVGLPPRGRLSSGRRSGLAAAAVAAAALRTAADRWPAV